MKIFFLILGLAFGKISFSQDLKEKLEKAVAQLQQDAQFEHALFSIYIVDSKTGNLVFAKNQQTGMVPASCQKIITAASAFELLGNDFTFKTDVGYFSEKAGEVATLFFAGTGDPTMGSFRYASTKEPVFMNRLKEALLAKGLQTISPQVLLIDSCNADQAIPDGWVWQDVGNYFGAGASFINWRENQYSIFLNAGKTIGDRTEISKIEPTYYDLAFNNFCLTAASGTGDNAYLYLGIGNKKGYIRGTIPQGATNFSISGAVPDAGDFFISALRSYLNKNKLLSSESKIMETGKMTNTTLFSYHSPSLDSINYWFLKKSINLYGEALVKSIGFKKSRAYSTVDGVNAIREFWGSRGVDKSALKIADGSGLSPSNRVTAEALVTVLLFAKKRPWFASFYQALPEMNGIKMKDGYIGGVRSYTGFVKSAKGEEYCFAFIVNNFDGSPSQAREKMWKVLDLLK